MTDSNSISGSEPLRIGVAADHGGFELKQFLEARLREIGHQVNDFGDHRSHADDRVEAPATPAEKKALAKLSADQIKSTELAGEKIEHVLSSAPGNGAALGGVKVITKNGWFAARPSGTENIYKIYAESFRDDAHVRSILAEAQTVVSAALAGAAGSAGAAS